jgi:hypothetical protein
LPAPKPHFKWLASPFFASMPCAVRESLDLRGFEVCARKLVSLFGATVSLSLNGSRSGGSKAVLNLVSV